MQSLPASIKSLSAISCPEVDSCVVAGEGGTLLTTSDGGNKWNSYATGLENWFSGVSCPSRQICYVTGVASSGMVPTPKYEAALLVTADGGRSWTSSTPSIATGFASITCPTPIFCLAVQQTGGDLGGVPVVVYSSDDAAKTWKRVYTVNNGLGYTAIQCPDAKTCYTLYDSRSVAVTADAGRTWRVQQVGTPYPITSLSCPVANKCYGVSGKDYGLSSAGAILTTTGRTP